MNQEIKRITSTDSSIRYSPWLALLPAPRGSHAARQVRLQLWQRLPA
jgi:hypothetical protein